MRYVCGFADRIVAALDDPDAEIRREAVCAAGNWEVDAAWPYVAALLTVKDTDRALLLAAIEAGVGIRPREAQPLLVFIERLRRRRDCRGRPRCHDDGRGCRRRRAR